ncbi:hypothetical protein Tco_0084472 [Tanacetum coccineum]
MMVVADAEAEAAPIPYIPVPANTVPAKSYYSCAPIGCHHCAAAGHNHEDLTPVTFGVKPGWPFTQMKTALEMLGERMTGQHALTITETFVYTVENLFTAASTVSRASYALHEDSIGPVYSND